jgi:hypothetical protein
VRDNKDISIFQCKKSGVIALGNLESVQTSSYSDKETLDYWADKLRLSKGGDVSQDDSRRLSQFSRYIENKRCLDVGCELGFASVSESV